MNDDNDQKNNTGVIRLSNVDEFIEYSCELISTAIRSIDLLTTDMDRSWLGDAKFVDALRKSIIDNRRVQVRLLMTDATLAIRSSHPLLELIKRLSRFQAKQIDDEILEKQPMKYNFILVDRGGIVLKQQLDTYLGFAHFDDKASNSNMQEVFKEYWRYSSEHPDLKQFRI